MGDGAYVLYKEKEALIVQENKKLLGIEHVEQEKLKKLLF